MATTDESNAPPSGCASSTRSDSLQRPFTASVTRTTSLIAVQVHWGQHLHLSTCARDALYDWSDREAPSTYIALRAVRLHDGHLLTASARGKDNEIGSYELQSSPFAATRVAERTLHPVWNEVLLVSMPIDWKTHTDGDGWNLQLDVVSRDHSQQEDFLVATALLPINSMTKRGVPEHIVVDLTSGQPLSAIDHAHSNACVYLSVFEVNHRNSCNEVAEVVVHDVEETKLDFTDQSFGAVVVLSTAPLQSPTCLRELFRPLDAIPALLSDQSTWISPIRRRTDRIEATLQLEFPMVFTRGHETSPSESCSLKESLLIYVFDVQFHNAESEPSSCLIGSGLIDLLKIPQDGHPIPFGLTLESVDHQAREAFRLNTTIRRWDAHSWTLFQSDTASRRVVTTNRRHRRRAQLQSLKWTGAICRGLNRYPVSSFCDEGGLSGVLATYLAVSSSTDELSRAERPNDHSSNQVDRQVNESLSNQHIRLLQQEVMAKQTLIQKLQAESETNRRKLEACIMELATVRGDVQEREEVISHLRAQLDEIKERDQAQTREILAASDNVTGLRLDSQSNKRLNMLIFKYKELDQKYQSTLAELENAKRALVVADQLERKYSDLEKAHVVQAALMQRLHKDKTKTAELQRTIRVQERVIGQLESAVTPSPMKKWTNSADMAELGPSLANSESKLVGVRLQVLEHQLESNAKSAATEIGRLKMRVMELEAQLSLSCELQRCHEPS